MRFGIYLNQFAHHPGHSVWPEMAAQASLADTLGYDLLGMGERHLHPPGVHEMMTTLGTLVAITRRIHLCSAGFILPAYHPAFLAAAAANLDVISGGRFTLGLVLGYRQEELALFEIPRKRRAAIFEERLTCLQQILTAEVSETPSADTPFVSFRPVRGHLPIWIGGAAEKPVRRAARMADGWIASANLSKEDLVPLIDLYREECARQGRQGTVVLMRDGFVAETTEEAEAAFADPLLALIRSYADWKRTTAELSRYQATEFAALRHRLICGDPDTCNEQVAAYSEMGVDTLLLRFQPPGLPGQAAERCIRLFAETIIPQWKEVLN